MDQEGTLQLVASAISKDLEVDAFGENISEEELFRLLSNHVAWLVENRLEWLLSLMYRMDIDERKVEAALSPFAVAPANEALAQLIMERQQQRVRTKQQYRPADLGEEWEW
ncbi:MAG: hypothetical protein R2795_02525 [Saprospiraceae bacterium]